MSDDRVTWLQLLVQAVQTTVFWPVHIKPAPIVNLFSLKSAVFFLFFCSFEAHVEFYCASVLWRDICSVSLSTWLASLTATTKPQQRQQQQVSRSSRLQLWPSFWHSLDKHKLHSNICWVLSSQRSSFTWHYCLATIVFQRDITGLPVLSPTRSTHHDCVLQTFVSFAFESRQTGASDRRCGVLRLRLKVQQDDTCSVCLFSSLKTRAKTSTLPAQVFRLVVEGWMFVRWRHTHILSASKRATCRVML